MNVCVCGVCVCVWSVTCARHQSIAPPLRRERRHRLPVIGLPAPRRSHGQTTGRPGSIHTLWASLMSVRVLACLWREALATLEVVVTSVCVCVCVSADVKRCRMHGLAGCEVPWVRVDLDSLQPRADCGSVLELLTGVVPADWRQGPAHRGCVDTLSLLIAHTHRLCSASNVYFQRRPLY